MATNLRRESVNIYIVPTQSVTAIKLRENSKNLECNSFSYCVLKQLKLFYSRHRLLNLMAVTQSVGTIKGFHYRFVPSKVGSRNNKVTASDDNEF